MRWTILTSRRAFRVFALSALGAVLILAGPLAAKSFAGTYTATECASSNTYSGAQYYESGHHMLSVTRDCGVGGGGLGIALPQAYWSGYGSEARFQLGVPAGVHFTNVSGEQQGVDADGWHVAVHACSPSVCSANVYVSGDGYWRIFGTPTGNYTNWFTRLICLNPSCYGSTAAGLHVRDVTMNMSDDVGPTVSFGQSSELLDGQIQRGTGRIGMSSADVGAGLTSVWVLVNEGEVARQNYHCTGSPMQPCPSNGGTLNFAFDTQGSPFHDGENTVQACAADYGAPPNVTCTAERIIHVDNSCTASGVPGGANLSAEFARSDSDAVNVKAGQGALLTGRLTDDTGHAVERATLCMKEGITGEDLDEVGTVRTDSEGRYRFSVSPGPNRRLLVGYRYNRHQLERDARFFSRLRPRLKLSPKHRTKNGELLRLFGSIPGPSNDDRVVILQAGYAHSKQWKTFAKAKTGADGRYLARYRFTATFSTTTYAMRALVPEQNGYPYQGGASRTKTIKVVGRAPGRG
jgi:hypothetical protein